MDIKRRWEFVTFAAADVRFFHRAPDLIAVSADLHTALEGCAQRTRDAGAQLQEFAGVGAADPRHRAGAAQVGGPPFAGGFQQTALLH